jgi:hypothetical protein
MPADVPITGSNLPGRISTIKYLTCIEIDHTASSLSLTASLESHGSSVSSEHDSSSLKTTAAGVLRRTVNPVCVLYGLFVVIASTVLIVLEWTTTGEVTGEAERRERVLHCYCMRILKLSFSFSTTINLSYLSTLLVLVPGKHLHGNHPLCGVDDVDEATTEL